MDSLLSGSVSGQDVISMKYDTYSIQEELGKSVNKYSVTDDVRIIPGKIVFEGAFDGKVFNDSFTIINCGKYIAVVRILPPSSKAFKLKPIPRGYKLSAGMSISRTVTYTHTSAMGLPEASFLIYINDKPIVYKIEINRNYPCVVLTPKELDFGDIDIRTPSEMRMLRLHNQGGKVSQFTVDLGRTDLDLIINPMKGSIDPSQVVEISVEVLGSEPGIFDKEFWIKTDPLQRVRITGNLIHPKLALMYPVIKHKLILVDFPRTYYGAEITRTFIIANSSSTASMFCLVLESDKGFDYLENASAKNDDMKCFSIFPTEGRLQARQRYPLRFTFHPKQQKSFIGRPYKDFALVFLRVVKVHYRDGNIDEDQIKTYQAVSDTIEQKSTETMKSFQPYYLEGTLEDDLKVCVYGEMEPASIKLTPSLFSITYLKINETYIYELNIRNMSPLLPITVVYNKIPTIDIEPKEVFLRPKASFEATIIIKPSRIGTVNANVMLDLICEDGTERCKVGTACLPISYLAKMECPSIEPKFNLGITPKITNEVGYLAEDVRFNSNVDKPIQAIIDKTLKQFNSKNKDLVAFPNDRPKSLRPWKSNVPCRTICANLPRYSSAQDNYALNDSESDIKKYSKQYYIDYIRNNAKKRHSKPIYGLPHYDVVDKKRILMEDMYFGDRKHQSIVSPIVSSAYVALSPKNLMAVTVKPKYVQLGQLAPYTTCTESFFIENENEFSISVSIKALSNTIIIKGKKKLIIDAHNTKQIFFDCWSHGIGKYNVPVYIIVNDYHIFESMVVARVVPTTVFCPAEKIKMDLKDKISCFELYNPVNCDITFSWEVPDESFAIFPTSGTIPPKRSLYCRLMFQPKSNAVHHNEIYLISQSGAKQIIKVSCESKKAEIGFHTTKLKFDNIPLNIPISKELVLRNFSEMEIDYYILNPHPLVEVNVSPSKGSMHPKSEEYFEVTVNFRDIVEFKCNIEFILQNEYSYIVSIEGNVVFPNLRLEPEMIQYRKTSSGAYQRRVFRIENTSEAPCSIHFCLEDFTEFFIADADRNVITDSIPLQPHEHRELFLEFRPTEPMVYSIYLPYIINGIIGPPALNDPRSVHPSNYFHTTNDVFKTAVELPENLPTVAIRCAAGAPWVEISSLSLNFHYRNNVNEILWTVTNICSIRHHLTIPLINQESPFNFIIGGDNLEVTHKYYKALLNPGEEAVFKITFTPMEFGSYDLEIPILVDKSIEKCPLNYLKLFGTYIKPTIFCSKNILYYQVILIKETVSETVTLDLIAHEENCTIEAETVQDALSLVFLDKIEASEGNLKIDVVITFSPKSECVIDSEIVFKCSCGVSCNLTVKAGASNCKFASYQSFMRHKAIVSSNEFKSTFPYFPHFTDDSYYSERMHYLISSFAEYAFIQKIFSRQFLKIPDSFCRIPITVKPISKSSESNKFKRSQAPVLPLVQVMVHLLYPKIVKFFYDSTLTPAFEGIAGTIYVYTTYRNIIIFLRSQNVFVPQLQPEYLLPYNLYLIFKQNINTGTVNQQSPSSEQVLSQQEFYRFSKQCWLDLILRIYKIFIYHRIVVMKTGKSRSPRHSRRDVYHKEFTRYFTENIKELEKDNMHTNEAILLLWTEFHYEKQKSVLFDLKVYPELKEKRLFRNFDTDFSDGMSIVTLLAAYCPYLIDDLKKFYPTFDSKEYTFHNYCLIFETVKRIKLPENLVQPKMRRLSALDLFMLMIYFFDTLPGFYPKETVVLSAALGDKAITEITLKNNGDFPIAYTPIFFSNERKDFDVAAESIVIQPKKTRVIKVTYNVKSVLKRNAVLVLSGETDGFKPAKAIAFNLVGIPKICEVSQVFQINVEVYLDTKKNIEIASPFEQPYIAKLYTYFGDQNSAPEDMSNFSALSMLSLMNVPRQICVDSECTFDGKGYATFPISFCYVSIGEFQYFIYFINEKVGDFCIKVNINSRMSKNIFVNLNITLPTYFSTTISCTCTRTTSPVCDCKNLNLGCPKLIIVDIPYKNDALLEGLKLMFKISTEEHEYAFWKNLLDYPKGFHILRNRLRNTFFQFYLPYVSVLTPMVKYKVEFSKQKVSCPRYITFDNVTSSGNLKFALHWNCPDEPREEFLTLFAEHGREIRRYRLIFKPKTNKM